MSHRVPTLASVTAAALVGGVIAYWVIVGKQTGDRDESAGRTTSPAVPSDAADFVQGHSPFPAAAGSRASDPSDDNWASEVITRNIDLRLKQLKQALESDAWIHDQDEVVDWLADDFECTRLIGQPLEEVSLGPATSVHQATFGKTTSETLRSLRAALAEVFAADHGSPREPPRVDFKTISIRQDAAQVETTILVELFRTTGTKCVCATATWSASWNAAHTDSPQLASLTALSYQQVTLARDRPLMEDVTDHVLGTTPGYVDQVLRGIEHWCYRLTRIEDMRLHGHHGLAIGDVNGDGFEDLYVCDAGGLPNRLYLQRPDGTVQDHSRESNANWLESTVSALLIDLDNDGDQDLLAATVAGVVFAENDGKGRFTPRGASQGIGEAHSMCAADADQDGDLDVYICVYGTGGQPGGTRGFEAGLPVPYSDANNGGRNVLLRNEGNFRFVDATNQLGLNQNNRRWSFAAAWEDYDLDGDQDLYVANDFGRNNLYRNDAGKFTDVAAEVGVEDRAAGMSVAWSDLNRDGRPDLYIGNMFSAAGRRVTYQRQFTQQRAGSDTADTVSMQRMARGNTLFLAAKNRFEDISIRAGATLGRWAWGSKPVDLNNDGYHDLVVANGYFTNNEPDDL